MTGDDLKRLRERNGWSQSDLARAINASLDRSYTTGSISPWETGKRRIPDDVGRFCETLLIETGLDGPGSPASPDLGAEPVGGDGLAPDEAPGGGAPPGGTPQPVLGGSNAYARACEELWELIGAGVGMVGAATGSQALMLDGQIIVGDKQALGVAWGKLAETNDTFRRMLVSMTEGSAWLQVALVTGTTVSKCYQAHAQLQLQQQVAPSYQPPTPGFGDAPVVEPSLY